jgi:predicted nucleic acid-binding protein
MQRDLPHAAQLQKQTDEMAKKNILHTDGTSAWMPADNTVDRATETPSLGFSASLSNRVGRGESSTMVIIGEAGCRSVLITSDCDQREQHTKLGPR